MGGKGEGGGGWKGEWRVGDGDTHTFAHRYSDAKALGEKVNATRLPISECDDHMEWGFWVSPSPSHV